jgi:hypothetical protein
MKMDSILPQQSTVAGQFCSNGDNVYSAQFKAMQLVLNKLPVQNVAFNRLQFTAFVQRGKIEQPQLELKTSQSFLPVHEAGTACLKSLEVRTANL